MEDFLTDEIMRLIDEKLEGLDDSEKKEVFIKLNEEIDLELDKLE